MKENRKEGKTEMNLEGLDPHIVLDRSMPVVLCWKRKNIFLRLEYDISIFLYCTLEGSQKFCLVFITCIFLSAI